MKHKGRHERGSVRKAAILLCVLAMLLSLIYLGNWELTRMRIERDNAKFSALYSPHPIAESTTDASHAEDTAMSTAVATKQATAAPQASPAVNISLSPMPTPTASPAPHATEALSKTSAPGSTNHADQTATPEVTADPAPTQTASPSITLTATADPDAVYRQIVDETIAPPATPDADTLVFAIETAPPMLSSFDDLRFINPEIAAFLRIEGVLSLPVVQRKNDNAFYLDHNFEKEESIAGTLFLDGSNLLVPEDDILIVYGHNMRNGTMFHALGRYESVAFLQEHPFVRFDTVYNNRYYVPFALLSVSAEPDSPYYLNIRHFELDDEAFAQFVSDMKSRSVINIPIDVVPGDHLLLLVTCEYVHDNGRLVLALRALRPGETEQSLQAQVARTWK